MKLFIAGLHAKSYITGLERSRYCLESFYYFKPWEEPLLHSSEMFLLDSGAFSFMNTVKSKIRWSEYIKQYADFINRHNIQYFFELDIDSLVGLNEVEKLRCLLEKETGRQCIPVWHKSRGLQYWRDMCKAYRYVAIGGIVTKEIKPPQYHFFRGLNQIAKDNKTKVHGLGFTSKKASQYGFYSVDSTSCWMGSRAGQIYYFNGKDIITKKFQNKRLKDYKKTDQYNFEQWLLYQRYLDR